jgi:hypothetical protein
LHSAQDTLLGNGKKSREEELTFPAMYLTRRDRERGGRLVLLINRRFNTTALNELPVLLTKKRYSCNPPMLYNQYKDRKTNNQRTKAVSPYTSPRNQKSGKAHL